MISTKMTKVKGNLTVVECNCKVDGIERWLRNCDSEGNITTFSQDASYNTIYKRRFDSNDWHSRVCIQKLDVD